MPAAEALLKEALLCCHHPGLNAYLAALLQVHLLGYLHLRESGVHNYLQFGFAFWPCTCLMTIWVLRTA